MIDIDMSELESLQRDMETFAKELIPKAAKNALNNVAFKAKDIALEETIPDAMKVRREAWMRQNTKVKKAKDGPLAGLESAVGSKLDHMALHEKGGVRRAEGGAKSVPIATPGASNDIPGTRPATKQPKRISSLADKLLLDSEAGAYESRGKHAKQRRLVTTRMGIESKKRMALMESWVDGASGSADRTGIYRIKGGRKLRGRRRNRGWPEGAKTLMFYDLSKSRVNIKRNPWLSPAVRRALGSFDEIYAEAMRHQLRKRRIFR